MADRYRSLERSHFDIVVVGSGIGGLAAAAYLAERGKSVLILDHHYVAGGNATTFRRRNYEFDIGLHYLGECGDREAVDRLLSEAGLEGDVEFRELDPDGFDRIEVPGAQFAVPRGIDRFERRLLSAFPGEAEGIEVFAELLREAQQRKLHMIEEVLGDPPANAPETPQTARHGIRTLSGFFDRFIESPALKAILSAHGMTYGCSPSRVALAFHAALMAHYIAEGAYYPAEGGQAIADRLVEQIEANGGKVLLLADVEGIRVEDGVASGVELHNKHVGRRTIDADVVVSNADAVQTFRELVGFEHLSDRMQGVVESYRISQSTCILCLGIEGDIREEGFQRSNYWMYETHDIDSYYRTVDGGGFPERPPIYLTSPSLKAPEYDAAAPEGVDNVQLLTIGPSSPEAWGVDTDTRDIREHEYADSERYLRTKKMYTDRLIEVFEAFGRVADLRDRIVYSELATPVSHRRYVRSTGGTPYGLAVTPDQLGRLRAGVETEVEGLFLCGTDSEVGPGILGSIATGIKAGRLSNERLE